jgi:hypothetical protein
MSIESKLTDSLQDAVKHSMDDFMAELSTDENKDYRRGFKAGALFSFLHMRAQLSDIKDLCDLELGQSE